MTELWLLAARSHRLGVELTEPHGPVQSLTGAHMYAVALITAGADLVFIFDRPIGLPEVLAQLDQDRPVSELPGMVALHVRPELQPDSPEAA
jgi:hypothetical protein